MPRGRRCTAQLARAQFSTNTLVSGSLAKNCLTVATEYSRRGTVKSVGGSYGTLVSSIERSPDGLVTNIVYGDLAGTTSSSYDGRRRLSSVQTYRGVPQSWASPPASYQPPPDPNGPPSTFQLLLQDQHFSYDPVNNPLEIRDWRNPDEWPSGAKPAKRKMQYDDLCRLTRIDYQHTGGDDSWVSPFAAENAGNPEQQDPRRAKPARFLPETGPEPNLSL